MNSIKKFLFFVSLFFLVSLQEITETNLRSSFKERKEIIVKRVTEDVLEWIKHYEGLKSYYTKMLLSSLDDEPAIKERWVKAKLEFEQAENARKKKKSLWIQELSFDLDKANEFLEHMKFHKEKYGSSSGFPHKEFKNLEDDYNNLRDYLEKRIKTEEEELNNKNYDIFPNLYQESNWN